MINLNKDKVQCKNYAVVLTLITMYKELLLNNDLPPMAKIGCIDALNKLYNQKYIVSKCFGGSDISDEKFEELKRELEDSFFSYFMADDFENETDLLDEVFGILDIIGR